MYNINTIDLSNSTPQGDGNLAVTVDQPPLLHEFKQQHPARGRKLLITSYR